MLLSIKTKLKLNKTQAILMAKHAGIARFTYNWGLSTWPDLYKDGLKPNQYILKKFFNNHVKPEFTWIKEKGICKKITQYAFDYLGESFQRFFKGLSEYPKFKKKGKNGSFTIDNFEEGWGQCLAELIAAQKLNNQPEQLLYGIVSNGKIWEFGQLREQDFIKNIQEYSISNLDKLFAGLNFVFGQS